MHDDGVFNECQLSDKSLMMKMPQTDVMDHNVSNDIIDSQLNSKDGDDDHDHDHDGRLYFCLKFV